MTTIAYKDGVLAADSRISGDGKKLYGTTKKAYKSQTGYFYAAAGRGHDCRLFEKWVMDGFENEKIPAFIQKDNLAGIIINPKGVIYIFEGDDLPNPINVPFFAIGSGAFFAIGVMAAGASAWKAVDIAAQFDCRAGDEIHAVCLHPTKENP